MDKTNAIIDFEIKLATTGEQIRSCYAIMQQLRPHLTSEKEFVDQVKRQLEKGYHLVYLKADGEVRALAGFRFLEFLAWGNVLYIDDLITDSEKRKAGYGSNLLKWIIEEAKKKNCDQIHLDSGPHRHDAHRLYLNHHFKIVCHHFALDLKA